MVADKSPMSPEVEALLERLKAPAPLLVVTGAGISLASGIPTFRGDDPGAIWKRDVTELGTFRYFLEEPEGSWRWYSSRFEKVLGAVPNDAHKALVEIERWRRDRRLPFLLVTQNIDGLHRAAGSRELVEVHGTASRVRCSRPGCRHGAPSGSLPRSEVDIPGFLAAPTRANVPRCPACGVFIRQHVLWFDETYDSHDDYQWERVVEAAFGAETTLFVGTSFSVGVTELAMQAAFQSRARVFSIDPQGHRLPGVTQIREASERVLPAIVVAMSSG